MASQTATNDIPPEGLSPLSSEDELEPEKLAASSIQESSGTLLLFSPGNLGWRDVSVIDNATDQTKYFLDTSQYTPGTPDLVLHKDSKSGPLVGAAHLHWAQAIKLGIGSEKDNLNWIEIKRRGGLDKHYEFDFGGKKYSMLRHREVKGMQKLSVGHYKIVDENSGESVAVFRTESLGKSRGSLQLAAAVEGQLEVVLLLAIASWREKWRRKKVIGQRRVF